MSFDLAFGASAAAEGSWHKKASISSRFTGNSSSHRACSFRMVNVSAERTAEPVAELKTMNWSTVSEISDTSVKAAVPLDGLMYRRDMPAEVCPQEICKVRCVSRHIHARLVEV